ncbi:hypothetical protein Q9K02_03760 [Qipengyuania sp. G39]|uniref:Uncharacterized protein n=1 Tax=Qipengyuania profundimaris TaxID=3067652 RepID=A0ABT9HM69_9SPHN|nr:hypothetical protein [Qipengyuania sp. G39]MDP4574252.1 hypothetical protein [Qipengyuania sp. G39]
MDKTMTGEILIEDEVELVVGGNDETDSDTPVVTPPPPGPEDILNWMPPW